MQTSACKQLVLYFTLVRRIFGKRIDERFYRVICLCALKVSYFPPSSVTSLSCLPELFITTLRINDGHECVLFSESSIYVMTIGVIISLQTPHRSEQYSIDVVCVEFDNAVVLCLTRPII